MTNAANILRAAFAYSGATRDDLRITTRGGRIVATFLRPVVTREVVDLVLAREGIAADVRGPMVECHPVTRPANLGNPSWFDGGR